MGNRRVNAVMTKTRIASIEDPTILRKIRFGLLRFTGQGLSVILTTNI